MLYINAIMSHKRYFSLSHRFDDLIRVIGSDAGDAMEI